MLEPVPSAADTDLNWRRVVDDILIERMTWHDVRDAMAAGKRTVIIPIAAMEQHGPHMAIGTDTFLGYETSVRLARALGDALVAPAISIGYSVGHLPMPGTVTISEETLIIVIREVVESLVHHGFTDVVMVVSHGGNFAALRAVVPRTAQGSPGCAVPRANGFRKPHGRAAGVVR